MTEQEQRISIATACGWKNCGCLPGGNMPEGEPDDDYNRDVCENNKAGGGYPTMPHREPLPNYLHDLNAMWEAERTILGDVTVRAVESTFMDVVMQRAWEVELYRIIRRDDKLPDQYLIEMYRCARATAGQRAEAFLKCKGLWK